MSQTYRDPLAIERMREGSCPECGKSAEAHGGWGGSGCSLTDNGVADRIEHQRQLDAAARSTWQEDLASARAADAAHLAAMRADDEARARMYERAGLKPDGTARR